MRKIVILAITVILAVQLLGCAEGEEADRAPPLIYAVTASGVTETGATITWTTDEGATSQVEYGLTTGYGAITPPVEKLSYDHSVALFGLAADTTYHYRVRSKDVYGNEAISEDYSFATLRPALSGGVLVTFDVLGESYKIFITNEDTIQQVFAVQRGESQATIPSGRLVEGAVFYNEPWSWHIDSEDIHMAEFTIELCDGLPSHVEADLDYWLNTVKRFCSWHAEIVQIEDFR